MNRRIPRWCLLTAWAGLSLATGAATPPTTKPATRPSEPTAKPGDAETLQFLQKNIEAQMQELQDRMFRLSELTRETEPIDSARLLLAVRRAREELILEEMKEVLEALGTKNVDKATVDTKQVIVKLEKLKELLLSTDFDLQLQLERLRKLGAAIAKVDAAIKEEKRQTDATSAMAAPTTQPAKSALAAAKQAQEQNRQATEQVKQAVADLGQPISAAAQTLGAASEAMAGASTSLGAGQCPTAGGQQKQATAKLQEARNQLEEERQKLLAEIEGQIKRQVLENLSAMLEKQKTVREANEAIQSRLAEGNREAMVRVKQLGAAEVHIANLAEQTASLIEETEFSFALPPALRSIGRRAILVTSDLQSGKGDETVVSAERQIEHDIAELLETFKASTSSSNGQSRCKACKSDKNKLLAELKVIRLLQMRVNQETKEVDAHRQQLQELPQALKDRIGDVREHQQQVHDTLDKLDALLNGREP